MKRESETCENCGTGIGRLETPMVHEGHVVCPSCWRRLHEAHPPKPVIDYASPPPTTPLAPEQSAGKTLYAGSPAFISRLPSFIFAGLLLLVGLVALFASLFSTTNDPPVIVGLAMILVVSIWVVVIEIDRRCTSFYVTSQFVYLKKGWLSRVEGELPVAHLREVTLAQGMFERLADVGSLGFSTSASAGVEIVWRGVKHPEMIRKLVRGLIR